MHLSGSWRIAIEIELKIIAFYDASEHVQATAPHICAREGR